MSGGFKGALNCSPMIPKNTHLSDSSTLDRCRMPASPGFPPNRLLFAQHIFAHLWPFSRLFLSKQLKILIFSPINITLIIGFGFFHSYKAQLTYLKACVDLIRGMSSRSDKPPCLERRLARQIVTSKRSL